MSDECEPELSEFIALLGAHPECRGEIRNILTQEDCSIFPPQLSAQQVPPVSTRQALS